MSYYFSVMGIYYSTAVYLPTLHLIHFCCEARELCAHCNLCSSKNFWGLAEVTLGLPAYLNGCILKVFVVLY